MKREDFEWLWQVSSLWEERFIPGPPDLPIDPKFWDELLHAQIVGTGLEGFMAECPFRGLSFRAGTQVTKLPLGSEPNFIPGECTVYNFGLDEGIRVIYGNNISLSKEVKMMALYRINRFMLAMYIAKKWEVQFDLKDLALLARYSDNCSLDRGGCQLGWIGSDTAVIIIDDYSDDYDLELLEEETEEEAEGEVWYLKKLLGVSGLYAITFGQTEFSLKALRRLYKEGITCLGTHDFLTDDGQPEWDISPSVSGFQTSPGFRLIDFDKKSRVLKCKDKSVCLTETQALIFNALYQNPDQVVEYQDLRKILWPDGKDKDLEDPEHTIDVHITNLRHKLAEVSNLEVIKEGSGFRLNCPDE